MPDAGMPKYLLDGRKSVRRYSTGCSNLTSNCGLGDWTDEYQMSSERWYPTLTTLADGQTIVVSGSKDNLDFDELDQAMNNPTYEYFPPKREGQWPRQLEILNWAYPFSLYPMVFQLPSGGVFMFVANKTVVLDPKTEQVTTPVPDMPVMNHLQWIYPYSPTMVMLPLTKKNNYTAEMMGCGGSYRDENGYAASSAMCWKIKPDVPRSQWVKEQDMPRGRVMLDSAILPDGTVLFINGAGWGLAGGDQGGDTRMAGDPIFEPSLFDPNAPEGQRWRNLAPAKVPRLYHSGVILLESGHVVTTGSEMNNYADTQGPAGTTDLNCFPLGQRNICSDPYEYRIERFTPPYLSSNKTRPILSSAPQVLTYDSTFKVDFAGTEDISSVSFIRYSTSTHSTNMDQRFVELEILAQVKGALYLKAPVNGALAPPGNWMLFILKDGIPSVAKTINLQIGPPTTVSVPVVERKGPSKARGRSSALRVSSAFMTTLIVVLGATLF